jgi:hypothetical protein
MFGFLSRGPARTNDATNGSERDVADAGALDGAMGRCSVATDGRGGVARVRNCGGGWPAGRQHAGVEPGVRGRAPGEGSGMLPRSRRPLQNGRFKIPAVLRVALACVVEKPALCRAERTGRNGFLERGFQIDGKFGSRGRGARVGAAMRWGPARTSSAPFERSRPRRGTESAPYQMRACSVGILRGLCVLRVEKIGGLRSQTPRRGRRGPRARARGQKSDIRRRKCGRLVARKVGGFVRILLFLLSLTRSLAAWANDRAVY